MRTTDESKKIVGEFLTTWGQNVDKAAEMITDDFVWMMPQSVALMFPGKTREARGKEGLQLLLDIDKQVYASGHHGEQKVTFMIAEGDYVVMHIEFATNTIHGVPYRNEYCFCFQLRGGKIAKAWEVADTLYAKTTYDKRL